MRAPISVIIPTLNAAASLPGVASSLFAGLEAGLIGELVIADAGSTDGTRKLAEELGAEVVDCAPGRGTQISCGVEASRGAWCLILHADSWPEPDWVPAVRAHIAHNPEMAGYFTLRFRANGIAPRLLERWANLRSAHFGLPYGDQGLLISRKLLMSAGGIPEIPLMEDVALARALLGKLRPLAATMTTSAERYQEKGWIRQSLRNGWFLAQYLAGASPASLARTY